MDIKIRADKFNFFYNETMALKNISMNIFKNTVVGIIGPSGCGKSTFLRSINRMNDVIFGARHEGDILIDGENIYDKDIDVVGIRRRIGMVFQKSNPFPKSIFDNVAYGLKINGIKDRSYIAQKVEKSLQDAALWNEVKDRLNLSGLRISGGQQQRVAIARAIVTDPLVLLADEPTGNLDTAKSIEVMELLKSFNRDKGITIIMVTHEVDMAAFATRKIHFRDGMIDKVEQ